MIVRLLELARSSRVHETKEYIKFDFIQSQRRSTKFVGVVSIQQTGLFQH